jgi:WD40 repeat protein
VAIDATGRRVAAVGSDVTVWDLATGSTVAKLGVGSFTHVRFDVTGAVLTSSPFLLRWPVHDAPGGATTFGPPVRLFSRGTWDGFSSSRDGGTIAAAMFADGGLVLEARNPHRARWLRPQRDVRYIAVSPDGRWVVTGSHAEDGLRLWDARTGRMVHDFPGLPRRVGYVHSFSPDGRWLAVSWDGWVLIDTKTWAPKIRLRRGPSGTLAFGPDGQTVAHDDAEGTLTLTETETGRELARLDDPEQVRTIDAAFAPDGSWLVTSLFDRPYLRVWDLRAIRYRLAALGLDWVPADYTSLNETDSRDDSMCE